MEKIIYIDTLTTGMNTDRCAIYRIGGIITEESVETDRFEMRVRPYPNARISDQSLWIGGESRGTLIKYPDEKDALAFLTGILDEHINVRNPKDKAYIAGFNASAMDVPFLRELFKRNGNMHFRDYFHVQVIDLMTLSAFALIRSRNDMPDFHLESAARALGLECPYGQSYNCLSNAKTCLDMYRLLEKRFGIGECTDVSLIGDIKKNF